MPLRNFLFGTWWVGRYFHLKNINFVQFFAPVSLANRVQLNSRWDIWQGMYKGKQPTTAPYSQSNPNKTKWNDPLRTFEESNIGIANSPLHAESLHENMWATTIATHKSNYFGMHAQWPWPRMVIVEIVIATVQSHWPSHLWCTIDLAMIHWWHDFDPMTLYKSASSMPMKCPTVQSPEMPFAIRNNLT